jgi:D-alanyl-D-alanine carboxypeptidase
MTADAEELRKALGSLLRARLSERGAACIAVEGGASRGARPVWLPESHVQEPAFLAYSVTKTFIAVLVLLLEQQGRLRLDDSLARWFPEIDRSTRITLRMLLNHTSGVPDYAGLRIYHEAVRNSPAKPWSFDQFAEHTWRKGLLFEPGTGWSYSNPGYMLLRTILARASGESFPDLVRSRICCVLELERTYVPESIEELGRLAPADSTRLSPTGERRDVRSYYHPGWVSHGVVGSTASELAVFLQALFSGKLIGQRALRELSALSTVPNAPPRWRKPSYGLGVMADPESPIGPVMGHNGGGPGYTASAFHASRFGSTVCAMCGLEDEPLAESLVFDSFVLL